MSVNTRIKYLGDSNLSKRNRPYRFQLDYLLNGKRVRETIKETTFYPDDSKDVKKEKERIIDRIKSQLEHRIRKLKKWFGFTTITKSKFY